MYEQALNESRSIKQPGWLDLFSRRYLRRTIVSAHPQKRANRVRSSPLSSSLSRRRDSSLQFIRSHILQGHWSRRPFFPIQHSHCRCGPEWLLDCCCHHRHRWATESLYHRCRPRNDVFSFDRSAWSHSKAFFGPDQHRHRECHSAKRSMQTGSCVSMLAHRCGDWRYRDAEEDDRLGDVR